jgi:hypothetical protein
VGVRARGITAKTIVNERGARGLAATAGYDHLFVAWTLKGKLHLTRFPAHLR